MNDKMTYEDLVALMATIDQISALVDAYIGSFWTDVDSPIWHLFDDVQDARNQLEDPVWLEEHVEEMNSDACS